MCLCKVGTCLVQIDSQGAGHAHTHVELELVEPCGITSPSKDPPALLCWLRGLALLTTVVPAAAPHGTAQHSAATHITQGMLKHSSRARTHSTAQFQLPPAHSLVWRPASSMRSPAWRTTCSSSSSSRQVARAHKFRSQLSRGQGT